MIHDDERELEKFLRPIGTLLHSEDSPDHIRSRFGIGFETLDRQMFDPDRVYPWLGRLGAGWARVQSGWSRCETAPGVYDFTWLEEIVDQLSAAGIRSLLSLSYGNRLYSPDAPHASAVGYVPLYAGEHAVQAWSDYVTSLVSRLHGKVGHWEVWNEPNIPQFWAPRGENGQDYAEFVAVTAAAIRRADPTAFVVGGAQSQVDPMFLQESLQAGMAQHIDALTFHPYQTVPEHDLRVTVELARGLLDRYSPERRIELWQGEAGCPSELHGHNDDWLGLYAMDEVIQATWVARRLVADRAAGFDRIFYFHAVDLMAADYRQSDGTARPPVMMGLLSGRAYQPKHSFHTFARVAAIFDERTVRRPLLWRMEEPDPRHPQASEALAAPQVATFAREDAPLVAFWVSTDPQQRASTLSFDVELWWDAELRLQQPVVVDVLHGDVYAVDRPAQVIPPAKGPVLGERMRLPVTDYPLVLTDLRVLTGLRALDLRLEREHPPVPDPLGRLRELRYAR